MWTGKKRQRFSNKQGITLSELVVASVIITVIMVGVVSVDYASRRIQKTAFLESQTSMKASAAMLMLTKNALSAVGDSSNYGIVYDDLGTDTGICFRHDTDLNPGDYSGDTWICFAHGTSNDLKYCDGLAAPSILCGGSGLPDDTDILELAGPGFFQIHKDEEGRLESIDFTLETVAYQGEAEDIYENPKTVITSSVSPVGAVYAQQILVGP